MSNKLKFRNLNKFGSFILLKSFIIIGLLTIILSSFKYSLLIEYISDGYLADVMLILIVPLFNIISLILFFLNLRLGWILVLFQIWLFFSILTSLIILDFSFSNTTFYKTPFYIFVIFTINSSNFMLNFHISKFWRATINIALIIISIILSTIYFM